MQWWLTDPRERAIRKFSRQPKSPVAYVTITTHNVPTTYYQTLLLINALWALFTRFCFTICSNLPCVSFQMAFSCLSCIFAASTLKLRFLWLSNSSCIRGCILKYFMYCSLLPEAQNEVRLRAGIWKRDCYQHVSTLFTSHVLWCEALNERLEHNLYCKFIIVLIKSSTHTTGLIWRSQSFTWLQSCVLVSVFNLRSRLLSNLLWLKNELSLALLI